MLTMILLSAKITGAVYFSACFFHYFVKFSPNKMIFLRINIYDSNQTPESSLQKQKNKLHPKIPWKRARKKVTSHNITRILSKRGTRRTNMAPPLRQPTVQHFEITRPRFKSLPLLFVWPWASHLPFLGSLYQ